MLNVILSKSQIEYKFFILHIIWVWQSRISVKENCNNHDTILWNIILCIYSKSCRSCVSVIVLGFLAAVFVNVELVRLQVYVGVSLLSDPAYCLIGATLSQ